jgi:hypothetical protein
MRILFHPDDQAFLHPPAFRTGTVNADHSFAHRDTICLSLHVSHLIIRFLCAFFFGFVFVLDFGSALHWD